MRCVNNTIAAAAGLIIIIDGEKRYVAAVPPLPKNVCTEERAQCAFACPQPVVQGHKNGPRLCEHEQQ